MPIDFLRLPIVAIIGMIFYAEALDFWGLLGAALILAVNFHLIRVEARAT
ncbi:MAG: hypothetical protein JJ894_13130 [Dinoroseobacter sp.]|nr:hypothetical protein [Dinoroseobacter sp.]